MNDVTKYDRVRVDLDALEFAITMARRVESCAEVEIQHGHRDGDSKKPVVYWVQTRDGQVKFGKTLDGYSTEDEARANAEKVRAVTQGVVDLLHTNLAEAIAGFSKKGGGA